MLLTRALVLILLDHPELAQRPGRSALQPGPDHCAPVSPVLKT